MAPMWCTTQSKINQSEHEKGASATRNVVGGASERASLSHSPEIVGAKNAPNLEIESFGWWVRSATTRQFLFPRKYFPLIAGRTGLINGGSGTDVNHGSPAIPPSPGRSGRPEWSKRLSSLPGTHNARYNLPTAARATFGCKARKSNSGSRSSLPENESLHYANP